MAESAVVPEVINSFQGAFGPPTLGHYKAMKFAAQKTLEDFPGKQILMLFMPTAESGSKPHLALTKGQRIGALNLFCESLQKEFPSNVRFVASDLEYQIYSEKKSSATIHTLRKLKELYPEATIILTMGLDNFLLLPKFSEISSYHEYTNILYILERNITDAEKASLSGVKGMPFFEHIRIEMLPMPPPTSSSLLRIALKKYFINNEKQYKNAIIKLIGRESTEGDPWHISTLRSGHLESNAKMKSFNANLALSFGPDAGPVDGGRRRKTLRKRRNRRNRRSNTFRRLNRYNKRR